MDFFTNAVRGLSKNSYHFDILESAYKLEVSSLNKLYVQMYREIFNDSEEIKYKKLSLAHRLCSTHGDKSWNKYEGIPNESDL